MKDHKIGQGSIVLLVSMIVGCQTFAPQRASTDFEVVRATKQKFMGGAPGSGSSVHYNFYAINHRSKAVIIDSVWIGGERYCPTFPKKPGKGERDTLLFRVIKHFEGTLIRKPRQKEAERDTSKRRVNDANPPEYEGAALIRFHWKNDHHRVEIDSFVQLRTISYP